MNMKTIMSVLFIALLVGNTNAQTADDHSVVHYKFPITFIENVGQWSQNILFGNLLADQKAYLLKDGIALWVKRETVCSPGETPSTNPNTTCLRFLNSSKNMKVSGELPIAAKSNFYRGSDKSKWHEDVTNYEKVVYSKCLENIDVEYGEENGKLIQQFIVNPGGRISDITVEGRVGYIE